MSDALLESESPMTGRNPPDAHASSSSPNHASFLSTSPAAHSRRDLEPAIARRIADEDLAQLVMSLREDDRLCLIHEEQQTRSRVSSARSD
jgi:hypothetical protein